MRLSLLALFATSLLAAACGGRSVSSTADGGPADGSLQDARALDGSSHDGGSNPCHGATLSECRQINGCTADLCYACSCTPSFEQCRALSEQPFQCPEYECPQPPCCGADAECTDLPGSTCAPPGSPYPCGICDPDPGDCASDLDCAAGDVCQPVPCTCDGASRCVPGCTQPTDCVVGTLCSGGDHPRCLPSACSPGQPCPPDFDCSAGACARRACTSDLECDHFCVQELCYDGYGFCQLPGA